MNTTTFRFLSIAAFAAINLIAPNHCACAELPIVVLHNFSINTADGRAPDAGLILSGSTLYGTTIGGGMAGSSGAGTVFSINTDGTGETILHSFNAPGSMQSIIQAGLTLDGNALYGTSAFGVFKVNTDGSGYQSLRSNMGGNKSEVTVVGSTLYGTVLSSGGGNVGYVYSIGTDGSNFQTIHNFSGAGSEGYNPQSQLTLYNSQFYGTTGNGGSGAGGTIFRMNLDGSGTAVLHSFSTSNVQGYDPIAGVTIAGSKIYGTASLTGGSGGSGSIFSMDLDGSNFTLLHGFTASTGDGGQPDGELTIVGDTIYGVTLSGGSAHNGSIFSVKTDGSDYQQLHSFLGATNDGDSPHGVLAYSDGMLYGTTNSGGINDRGIVFAMAVPEPATWYLAAVGAGCFALLNGVRRRAWK